MKKIRKGDVVVIGDVDRFGFSENDYSGELGIISDRAQSTLNDNDPRMWWWFVDIGTDFAVSLSRNEFEVIDHIDEELHDTGQI